MKPHRAHVREVIRPQDPAVDRGYRLLQRTFPKAEVVRRSEWHESLRERKAALWTDTRWHLVVAEVAGKIAGVVSGTYLGNVNTGVIGYLVVARSARRSGIGPRLRARLEAAFRRDALRIRGIPLQAVVGEVRRDNPWLRTLMLREQVLALDFPYLQPQLRRSEEPVSLVFYYKSLDHVRRRLSAATIRRLLYTIWRRIYRIRRPLSDLAFRRMLAALSTKRTVGAIRLPAPPTRPRAG